MKRFGLRFLLILTLVFFVYNYAFSGEINEPSPLSFLSFVSYQTLDSNIDGDVITRNIKIMVQNTSDSPIDNLKLTIDSYPQYITISSPQMNFSVIAPGTIVTSADAFIMSVDQSQIPEEGIRIIWQVECDIDGTHIFDETAVIEYL